MNKINNWRVPYPLTGNCFIYGRVGSGKSCKMLTMAQGYHNLNYKIWDIFGGKRHEGPFWCFPNEDKNLWRQLESEVGELKNEGPKQYTVKIFKPMFSKKLPKKLPNNPPNVKTIPFCIPFRELQDDYEQLIATVLGPLGSNAKNAWNKIINNTNINSTGYDLRHLMDENLKKFKKDRIWSFFIKPIIDNHFFCSQRSQMKIDFIEESKDIESIFVLDLEDVPESFHYFIMGWILKNIFDIVRKNKTHKKNIGLFREASTFMKVVDSDKSKEETTQVFRNLIVQNARYCRSGFFLFMDTQDSSEVKGMIEGSDDLLLINEMPSPNSREVTCRPLIQDKRMSPAQMSYIGWQIKIHEALVIERGKKAKILARINPPRCEYWKSEYGDFKSYWKRKVGIEVESSNFIDIIKEEYEERKKYLISTGKADKEEDITQEINNTQETEIKPKIEVKKELNQQENTIYGNFSTSRFE